MDISPDQPSSKPTPKEPSILKTAALALGTMIPAVVIYSYGALALAEHLGLS